MTERNDHKPRMSRNRDGTAPNSVKRIDDLPCVGIPGVKKEEEPMSTPATIVLIIVILVVVAAIVYGIQVARRRKLRNTFGPEYDRVVAEVGGRTEAEKELREREKRHAELELKPLSPESQNRYAADWEEAQIQFVDNPGAAVTTADELVTRLMAERGYPTENYDSMLADLSVEHAGTLEHYREAHAISRRNSSGEASPEDLRQALV